MTTNLPAWATTTAPERLDFTQVEELVTAAGGSPYEATVGAGIALGVESSGTTQVLSGGVGPAQGLWQFEPITWRAYAPAGAPPTAGGATPFQQAQAFVAAIAADGGFAPWAPDLGGTYTPPSDPTSPAPGSPVADYLSQTGVNSGTPTFAGGTTATTTGLNINPLDLFGIPSEVGGAIGSAAGSAASSAASSLWSEVGPFIAKGVLVCTGLGLVILGLYKTASPDLKQEAVQAAPLAELAAA